MDKTGSYFMWNPALMDDYCAGMSLEEVGSLWRSIIRASQREDVKYLRQFPFIGRFYGGSVRRERVPSDVRRKIYERDGHRCIKCGSTENLQIDHIVPWRSGGNNDESNLQTLCAPCNRAKGPTRKGCYK